MRHFEGATAELEALPAAPVVILGAPRSGTNLLRDLLTRYPGAVTWPCDEINYIWRHGNRAFPSDELPASAASNRVRRYVRSRFRSIAPRDATHVIEKTCANCLRVPFVEEILPEARYVHIVRDGRDAVLSSIGRWTGSAGVGYLLRKARYVPPGDVAYHALRFLRGRLGRYGRSDGAVASWGPRFTGMDDMVRSEPLYRVCAEQWKRCVRLAADSLDRLGRDRFVEVRYEALVASPTMEVARVAEFLGLPTLERPEASTAMVHGDSVGRWRSAAETVGRITPLIERELARFGYETD